MCSSFIAKANQSFKLANELLESQGLGYICLLKIGPAKCLQERHTKRVEAEH